MRTIRTDGTRATATGDDEGVDDRCAVDPPIWPTYFPAGRDRSNMNAGATSETDRRGATLVTGAAGGIGCELSRQFARHGHDVILVDRDGEGMATVEDALEHESGDVAATIDIDLTDEDAADRIVARVEERELRVETLVNNAGAPVYGRFTETDFADTAGGGERAAIRLNVEALTALTDRFVGRMVDRGAGRILNTASLAGVYPVPTAAVYGGTKAYVLSFSLALADELAEEGVTVTALCPGETATAFLRRGGMDRSAVSADESMDPEVVARAGYAGATAGKRIVVPGLRNRARYHLARVVPRSVGARLSRWVWSGRW